MSVLFVNMSPVIGVQYLHQPHDTLRFKPLWSFTAIMIISSTHRKSVFGGPYCFRLAVRIAEGIIAILKGSRTVL